MSDQLKALWDERYASNRDLPHACQVLRQFSHLLPSDAKALDFACGLGGNALLLSAYGLTTSAWDLSQVAIEKLTALAHQQSVDIETQIRDVILEPLEPNSFDVIVVSYFLERDLFPSLLAALKPSGLLFYETFIVDKADDVGPSNPGYLLNQNELLQLCDGLVIRAYREEGMIGSLEDGVRNVAMVVAQRDF